MAAFDDVEDMNADEPARKGRTAVAGLAIVAVRLVTGGKTM